ncbi:MULTISPECIES: phenylalanine--tRNA ligase subunit beta [unclassified Bacillus (in: firmicutes)]|uniref:phenylalanine--tRNA ligase subunit beta n=1 Tax=unclassified Bacillus (in: firmicutes) TaxID=185979 RepID=UPI00047E7A4B|nr:MULTISPECIES: phenylalanine--tRNA ligase subunit beta [unclassified Bacillus (in: firmicutes)]SDY56997.1 phenylalanyl-tRNA synthetase beta subunit [Bacillus sp. 166amftsu]
MFVSYRWLQEYVDIKDVTAQELADKITKSGIEVEGVEVLNKGVKGVVVGHVLECEKHPEADKLSKCLIDIGEEEPVQIICGAPNIAKGLKVPVAKVGAVLPGNFKIKKAKLRGEASHGMVCALQELGIDGKLVAKEYADGIFIFPSDAEVGADALEILNLHDEVLELGLTPNRADCLNMLGVAYEVAAIYGREVKLPAINLQESTEKTADYISVSVEAKEENPLYIAKMVKNVKIGPSPMWMQTRLMAAGIRPISNVVDITNYILMEYGQPLHAFDYDKLGSKEIVVRLAKESEKIQTLDDQERTLQNHHLVITNGEKALAVAGVMGGADSEVTNDTVNVLIESAYFAGQTVRRTSKDLGLRSESSARFEKGIDPTRTFEAIQHAAALMAKYAGGEALEGVVEVDNLQVQERTVSVTTEKVNRVLGTEITASEMGTIFTNLKFPFTEVEGTFHVNVPVRRPDITIAEDLVEEVGRLYGYDHIPVTLPTGTMTRGKLTVAQTKRRKARRYLEGAGLYEAITYSLTSADKAKQYMVEPNEQSPVNLALPMSEERSQLRLSLVPQLLEAVSYNNARKNDSVALYEVGSIFLPTAEGELPKEEQHLAGVMTGLALHHAWQGEKKVVDFFVAKGVLEGLFDVLGVASSITYAPAKREGMHPGRTADILLDGEVIGFIGQLHPETQKQLDVKDTFVFELSLVKVFGADVEETYYSAIPRFPSMTRDMAVVVAKEVKAGEMKQVIAEAGGELLKEVTLFDLYEGEKMEEGKKSLAFSMNYFDPERTLTDEEVTEAHNHVLTAVEEKFGAELRK